METNQEIDMKNFDKMVEIFKFEYLNMWWGTSAGFPNIGNSFTKNQQLLKEKELDKKIGKITDEMKKAAVTEEKRLMWRENIKWAMREIGGSALGFDNDDMSNTVIEEFSRTADDFIKEARRFNPNLGMRDINQAIRNLWIANSIQVLLNKEIGLTPSIFAYSMLYPYTDNFLDDPDIINEEKKSINKRFRKCLTGEPVLPVNEYEEALFRLVGMIENQYPRESFQEVFQSLLAIHVAQEKSLMQQGSQTAPYETDIIGISFEKGGTSVLADAFLVDPKLPSHILSFMFGFGVFLQLIDDVEDSMGDARNSHMTIFSQLTGKWELDKITNRLFDFINRVMEVEENKAPANIKKLKDIIKNNSYFLVLESIAKNRKSYSRNYVKAIERFSPYRFSYIIRMKKRMKKQFASFDLDKVNLE